MNESYRQPAPGTFVTVTVPAIFIEEARATFERMRRYRESFAELAKRDPDVARMLEAGGPDPYETLARAVVSTTPIDLDATAKAAALAMEDSASAALEEANKRGDLLAEAVQGLVETTRKFVDLQHVKGDGRALIDVMMALKIAESKLRYWKER